jgi:TonB family protein
MTDRELNGLFPEESGQGKYSINPYTYGDYVFPDLGYVPNRFTVFQVTINNYTYAKVELNPLEAVLRTDRGEVYHTYGISSGSAEQNFESYYRALRGPSGNEYYRFDMRMGIVRSNNYGINEQVFKGENYSGFIVFDPLDDGVRSVALTLRRFVLKFDAFDRPIEETDLVFGFDRRIEERVMVSEEGVEGGGMEESLTQVQLASSSEVIGNLPGDGTREVQTIDGFIRRKLGVLHRCFEEAYVEGLARAGEVKVRFTIRPNGTLMDVRVVSSGVGNVDVERCVLDQVARWRFEVSRPPLEEESGGVVREGVGDRESGVEVGVQRRVQATPAVDVYVTCSLRFQEAEGISE